MIVESFVSQPGGTTLMLLAEDDRIPTLLLIPSKPGGMENQLGCTRADLLFSSLPLISVRLLPEL